VTPRTKLFLYGSLMRGCCNHHHISDQRFIGDARTVTGYRLYELNGYPGMVVEDSDTLGVPGELWEIDADCLARLNRFEGTDAGLYRLASIPLRPPFDKTAVVTYLYLQSISGRNVVEEKWREGRK